MELKNRQSNSVLDRARKTVDSSPIETVTPTASTKEIQVVSGREQIIRKPDLPATNPTTGVAQKGEGLLSRVGKMSTIGKVGVAAGAIGVAALGARALRRRRNAQGPPPTQYYQRGDVWPNQDSECGRIEYKAFNNPKQFV